LHPQVKQLASLPAALIAASKPRVSFTALTCALWRGLMITPWSLKAARRLEERLAGNPSAAAAIGGAGKEQARPLIAVSVP
jgi:hypothetical protein